MLVYGVSGSARVPCGMTHVLVMTTLETDSGLAEDFATNTWHIDTTATDPVEGTTNFIGDLGVFFQAIDVWLGATLSGVLNYRAYDMSEPTPRVPFLLDQDAITVGDGDLPQEVALCLSFQGVRISGEDQASRRGRVFIGPLTTAAAVTAGGRPHATLISNLAVAGDTLATSANADTTYRWVVYSPTTGGLTTVNNGWVDNAFDTQRRRGLAATSRTTWSV